MSSMAKSEFEASLSRLENMAKGGATQLHHTSGDSDPGSHAGTSTKDYQEEHKDGIDDNGTDYSGVQKALAAKVERSEALTKAEVAIVKGVDPRPFIVEKINKGETLTPAESWYLSKGTDKPKSAGTPGETDGAMGQPDSHAGGSTDDEIEADAKKSLASASRQHPNLRKGLEMSPILAEFAHAVGTALQGTEARTVQAVNKAVSSLVARVESIEKSLGEQGAFNNAFAETLVGIGQHVAGNNEVAQAQASMPAGAPKSQFRVHDGGQGVQAVQKSFGPGGLPNGAADLQKSQIIDHMSEMVKGGQLNALDVVKFETTGELSPHVQQMVLASVQKSQ